MPELAIGPERLGSTVMDGWATADDLAKFPGKLRGSTRAMEVSGKPNDQVNTCTFHDKFYENV